MNICIFYRQGLAFFDSVFFRNWKRIFHKIRGSSGFLAFQKILESAFKNLLTTKNPSIRSNINNVICRPYKSFIMFYTNYSVAFINQFFDYFKQILFFIFVKPDCRFIKNKDDGIHFCNYVRCKK